MNQRETEALYNATMQSIENPMQGYNSNNKNVSFGKSAIKTYRSFLFPKQNSHHHQNSHPRVVDTTANISSISSTNSKDEWRLLSAMAARTAQQIDFLWKRHTAHETQWIRHHDGTTTTDTTEASTTTPTGSCIPARTTTRTTTFPIILLLDNIRSAMNVGSLFRTADAAGCRAVWTTGITPHPHGNGADKLPKAALGAEHVVPSRHFCTTLDAIQHAKQGKGQRQGHGGGNDNDKDGQSSAQYTLIGMETTSKSVDYTKVVYPDYYFTRMKNNPARANICEGDSARSDSYSNHDDGAIVLVLGNEVTGIDAKVLKELDVIVEIPMFGVKNSLNVAACAPIVIYEILRQWNNNNNVE
jgi:23S rRNA (guanosine2251-2'-O)-methyltransferase